MTTHWPEGETFAVCWIGLPTPVIVTVTVGLSSAAVPAVPLISGVVSLVWEPFSGVESVIDGGIVSTVNVCSSLYPVLLASSAG